MTNGPLERRVGDMPSSRAAVTGPSSRGQMRRRVTQKVERYLSNSAVCANIEPYLYVEVSAALTPQLQLQTGIEFTGQM